MIVYHAYHKDSPAFYVGKTINTLTHRRRQHECAARTKNDGSYFHKALRKYGAEMFDWRVLAVCDSIEEMNETERQWIQLVRSTGHKIYNISDGGDGGDGGGSQYWKEHGIAPETKIKISNTLKEYYKTHDNPMKGASRIGKAHTAEAKRKMSETMQGHPVSSATRQKLREANLGKKASPEAIEKMKQRFGGAKNPSAKPIICVTTGECFDYATLAAKKYNIDLSSIIKCCKGKNKTVGGMVFRYQGPETYPAGWEQIGPIG